MTLWTTGGFKLFLGCLLLSAINGDRVDPEFQNLFFLVMELSREECLDLATMKTKDPLLLSDWLNVWELFFYMDKGLANMLKDKRL